MDYNKIPDIIDIANISFLNGCFFPIRACSQDRVFQNTGLIKILNIKRQMAKYNKYHFNMCIIKLSTIYYIIKTM